MHIFAKIAGWSQFALQLLGAFGSQAGQVHGWQGWLALIGSGVTAVAVHGAASTDGVK